MLPVIKRTETNRMPSWFNDFFSEGWPSLRATAISEPAVNIIEDDEHYHVHIAAPGRTKEDFTIHQTDPHSLVVTLHQKDERCTKKEGCKFIQHEFNLSRFEQTITLPDDVDRDKIAAKMENGVLFITLPKLSEEQRLKTAKVIEIN